MKSSPKTSLSRSTIQKAKEIINEGIGEASNHQSPQAEIEDALTEVVVREQTIEEGAKIDVE